MSKTKKTRVRDIPVLKGIWQPGTKSIEVWCPVCNAWHVHGWDYEESQLRRGTHRISHCRNCCDDRACSRMFYDTGYLVKEFSKAERQRMFEKIEARSKIKLMPRKK